MRTNSCTISGRVEFRALSETSASKASQPSGTSPSPKRKRLSSLSRCSRTAESSAAFDRKWCRSPDWETPASLATFAMDILWKPTEEMCAAATSSRRSRVPSPSRRPRGCSGGRSEGAGNDTVAPLFRGCSDGGRLQDGAEVAAVPADGDPALPQRFPCLLGTVPAAQHPRLARHLGPDRLTGRGLDPDPADQAGGQLRIGGFDVDLHRLDAGMCPGVLDRHLDRLRAAQLVTTGHARIGPGPACVAEPLAEPVRRPFLAAEPAAV